MSDNLDKLFYTIALCDNLLNVKLCDYKYNK